MPLLQSGWVGVDLGTQALKVAQLERRGDSLRLTRAAIIERWGNGGATAPGDDALAAEMSSNWTRQEVQAALELGGGFCGRAAACVLPWSATRMHFLEVPAGTPGQRRAMIAIELEGPRGDDGPIAFDYWEVGDEPDSGSVAVIQVPDGVACRTADCLARSGLRCEVLDGLPTAVARAVQLCIGERAEPVAAIDWGHTHAVFHVVQEGRSRYVRELRGCGYGSLVAAVSASLGVSIRDAQQLLASYGLPAAAPQDAIIEELQNLVGEAARSSLLKIETQLRRTLTHLRLHRPKLTPKHGLLLGGGATIRNVAAQLGSRVDLPLESWAIPAPPGAVEQGLPISMLAVAAALSALAWTS